MNLLQLYAYFAGLPALISELDHFVQGEADEIIDRERTGRIQGVTLWMETPDSMLGDEHGDVWMWRMLVLAKASPRTTEKRQEKHHLTHQVAKRIIARLYADDEAGTVSLPQNRTKIKLHPAFVGSDGMVGWYFDIAISNFDNCVADAEIGL